MPEITQKASPRDRALTNRIMRRVYLVYGIRMLLHPVFLKSVIALVILYRSTAYISYANVFANAPTLTDLPRNLAFLKDAYLKTDAMTATLLMGFALIGVWIAFDLFGRSREAHSF